MSEVNFDEGPDKEEIELATADADALISHLENQGVPRDRLLIQEVPSRSKQKIVIRSGHDQGRIRTIINGWIAPSRTVNTGQGNLIVGPIIISGNGRVTQPLESADPLLLQAIVIPHSKTADGTIIEAVGPAWFEIIRMLKEDPDILYKIDSRKMEELIAGSYERDGFDEVTLTPRSGDLGRDIIAVKRGLFTIRIIDQVKRYKPSNLVTVDEVGALMHVLDRVDTSATHGVVTTTSDFAPTLATDPRVAPFLRGRLTLINGAMLLPRLEELSRN
jgi:restriction system protein